MRQWVRTIMADACGFCGESIHKGDPVFEIAGPGWRKVRCVKCAGEPTPQEMPMASNRLEFPSRAAAPLADMASDFKLKQAGDNRG